MQHEPLRYNYLVIRRSFLLIASALMITSCGLQVSVPGSNTSTPFIITVTLAPTAVPSATLTPPPPTPSPTTTPVEGTTTTQVNIRSQPSTAAPQLGILPPFTKVQIIAQDTDGIWFQILYPQGADGTGWVTAQYVVVPQGKDQIPTIGGASPAGTPSPGATSTGPSGVIIQQVNVRKGPGTDFDAIGTLNPQDTVTLTGKDPSGGWLQIQFAGAQDGLGWVAASYVQFTGNETLPIIGASGDVIGTATAPAVPPAMTPTPAAALQDNDSPQAPAANVAFSSTGVRTLIYSGKMSAPAGDKQDWIEFTTYATNVHFTLGCTGNSVVDLALTSNGEAVSGWVSPACGESLAAQLPVGEDYLVRVSLVSDSASHGYVQYTLRIENTG